MTTVTTRWFWIRHAPVIGHDGRIYGSGEVDCDVSNRTLFQDLAAALPADALWITSHLSRTRKTAQAILDHRQEAPELRAFADLAEQDFGEWQGLTHAELAKRNDAAYHHFWIAPARHQPLPARRRWVSAPALAEIDLPEPEGRNGTLFQHRKLQSYLA